VNVTFAQDKLESDLGFSGAVYGFGAGVFFIAYFFLEVPSNLALHKFAARKWIARIMFTWGIISACTALVQGPASRRDVRRDATPFRVSRSRERAKSAICSHFSCRRRDSNLRHADSDSAALWPCSSVRGCWGTQKRTCLQRAPVPGARRVSCSHGSDAAATVDSRS